MRKERERVVLVGSGGHAKVVLDILEAMENWDIVGVTIEKPDSAITFCGYPILGDDRVLSDLLDEGVTTAAIGVGGFTNNLLRKNIFNNLISLGFKVATLIHPSVMIARDVLIGEGSVFFGGVVINPGVRVGRNVVVATGSTVDHETQIEDDVLISAGVTVGAMVKIEKGALLAIGSTVVSGRNIGKNSLVAAGAVVVEDVAQETIVVGVPARIQKNR
jgi:UDP-perosamine 4-acetyltransferase